MSPGKVQKALIRFEFVCGWLFRKGVFTNKGFINTIKNY